MASQKFSSELIAKRYAISLYELSSENKCIEEVLKDLLIIEEYIKRNNDFNLLVRSPLISSKEKLKILQKILSDHSANVLTSKFIQVISYNKRINFLSSIIKKFIAINAEKRGDIIADITSAEELTGHQKDIIKNQLRLILGKKL